MDGDLQMLKKHYSSAKHISIDYTPFPRGGSVSDLTNIQESGISVVKDIPGRLEVLADTSSISVSHVISILNSRLEINDLSITGTTMDEMVVSLYHVSFFKIRFIQGTGPPVFFRCPVRLFHSRIICRWL